MSEPSTAATSVAAPRRNLASLAAGLALAAAYVAAERALPRGPAEFAYAPDLFVPLPFAAMRGFTFEQLAAHALRLLLLGPALLLLWHGLLPHARLRPPGPRAVRRLAVAAGLAGLLLSAAVMALLGGRGLHDDELTYRMQAELLAQGRLAEDRYPRWGHEPFTIWTGRGATGKYQPGEPLGQVPGILLGVPALLHLPLAALTLAAWAAAVRRRAGPETAGWATVLVALSPMFVLTTPTGLSHATALACAALAALGYEWLRAERPRAGAAALGGALAYLLAVRPQSAVALGLVLGPLALARLLRARRLAAAALLVACCALGVAAIALYDRAITGSPWTLPWALYQPVERYGFGHVLEGSAYVHGPRQAVENLLVSAVRFNGWWLGWPASLALLLVPGAVRGAAARRALGAWGAVALSIVLVHLFYYSPGVSDTGPVYYYELLLPASLAGAAGIRHAVARWGGRALLLVALAFGLGTGSFLAEQTARLGRLVELLHRQPAAALAAVDPPALLLHETSGQENLRLGWMFGFPLRERRPDAPVLTFPRGAPGQAAALRRRFADRACWYYRVDPARLSPDLRRCEQAEALLARPRPLPGPRLFLPSTARRLRLVGGR